MPLVSVEFRRDLSWIDVVSSCDPLGLTCYNISSSVRKRIPVSSLYVGPLRVVYSDCIDHLKRSRTLRKMIASRESVLLLVGCSLSEAESFEVTTTDSSLSGSLVEGMSGKSGRSDISGLNKKCMETFIIAQNQKDSILQRISPNLYRITDKKKRELAQMSIYRYLSGELKRPPVTGIQILDSIIRSDVASRLREACSQTRTERVDIVAKRLSVDRFEVGYVLRKVTSDPGILSNIAFEDED